MPGLPDPARLHPGGEGDLVAGLLLQLVVYLVPIALLVVAVVWSPF